MQGRDFMLGGLQMAMDGGQLLIARGQAGL